MKRASIGLGILITFFLLAMFLMTESEISQVDEPVVSTGAPTTNPATK